MDKIKELLQDIQAKLAETVKGVDDKPLTILDAFKMFPELQAKYGELETRLKEIEKHNKTRKWADVSGLDPEKFSLCRAINAIRSGKHLDQWETMGAGFEADVFRHTRAMSTGSDSDGGYLVPVQAMPDFIEMFQAKTVCIALGATVIPGLKGAPVVFSKQTGGAIAYWVGENKEIEETALKVGELHMTPKKVASLVKLSNELVRLGNPGAEAMVRNDLAGAVARAADIASLRGSGSQYQPLGIANTPGISSVVLGENGDTLKNFDLFIDMEGKLEDADALDGKLGFAFAPVVKRNAKKLKVAQFSNDTGGAYVVPRPVSDQELTDYLGWAWKTSTQIPVNLTKGTAINCTEVYFANWAELLIGQWMGFEILSSNVAGTAFATDQTWIRIITMMDIGLRHPASFCLCNDLKIA